MLELSDGSRIHTASVIVATGVSYRRLEVDGADRLLARGVFYGAAVSEAPAMSGCQVYVIGGGNSAGQAAVHLSKFAAHVTILVRGTTLADSMSEYLIREIDASPTIDVVHEVEVAGVRGRRGPDRPRSPRPRDGRRSDGPRRRLFVLIGSEPRTDWLEGVVARDKWGFVLTGSRRAHRSAGRRRRGDAFPLETSVPGVLAVGDVRRGSVKRVASAVGEGTIAVPLLHHFLDEVRHVGAHKPN